MTLRSLEGFLVGVTADRRWEEQAELLFRRGATVVHGPTMSTSYLAEDDHLQRATEEVIDHPPDYVVATTGIGMRAWLEAAAAWGREALTEALGRARIVARGPKASAALQVGGLTVCQRSPNEQMGGLIHILLGEDLMGRRVVVQEYGVANADLAAALSAAGAETTAVPVYRWRLPEDPVPARRLVKAACAGQLDAVTFTSAPAVHNLFALAENPDEADRLRAAFNGAVVAGCVGPVCAQGAREEGIEDPVVPDVGRLGLLVRALGERLGQRRQALRLAGHEVVIQGGVVEVDGDVEALAPKDRAILELLATKPGSVVGRERFLRGVWGRPGPDGHVLEVAIGRLRRRLGPAGAAIQAIPGRGYRLDVEYGPG